MAQSPVETAVKSINVLNLRISEINKTLSTLEQDNPLVPTLESERDVLTRQKKAIFEVQRQRVIDLFTK